MASTIQALSSGSGGLVSSGDASGILQIQTGSGPTTAITVDASQNVGIGTTSPDIFSRSFAKTLGIDGSSGAANTGIQINGNTSYNAEIDFGVGGTRQATVQVSNTYFAVTANTSIPILFSTNNTERMRLDSSGNLLVGTTSQANSEKFNATQSSVNSTIIANNTNASFSAVNVESRTTSTSTNGTFYHFRGISNGVNRFIVYDSGNVVNTNNSYGAISDVKLKENIVDASPKLVDLMQVKVRQYNLKSDQTHKQIGVVAQELETVFPSMIDEAIDRDAEGNDLGTTTKSVKYSVFVPMLIKAIQELSAQVTALQAQVKALQGAK